MRSPNFASPPDAFDAALSSDEYRRRIASRVRALARSMGTAAADTVDDGLSDAERRAVEAAYRSEIPAAEMADAILEARRAATESRQAARAPGRVPSDDADGDPSDSGAESCGDSFGN